MSLFELNETQQAVRDLARDFARRRIAPTAKDNDAHERFPADILKELAELGLMGVNVPSVLGGTEAGAVSYALAMMELSEADASVSVTTGVNNMVAEAIVKFGSKAQREKYVPRICSGEYVAGSFALSEPHAGSDPRAMRTTAVRKGDRWILSGSKQWITSGAHAGVFIVWARTNDTDRGISAFLVEAGTPGLVPGKAEDKMGLRASNTVTLSLDEVAVPLDAILGEEGYGFRIAMNALDGGRIGIGAQATGILRAALSASAAYAKERAAFGKPISEFQSTQWKLADMATDADAAELLVLRAAALKDAGVTFSREASMAKLYASEAVNRAVGQAVQIHGGYGFVKDYPVERYFRDARVTTIYEGTSEVQRLVIAREVLKSTLGAEDHI